MADQETTGGTTPEQTASDAPAYHQAAAEGRHLDTTATGGTNFAPDLSLGPGRGAAQSGVVPGGDYARHRALRDEGRRKRIAELAEAAAKGGADVDARLLTTGGLAVTFETNEQGEVVKESVQIEGIAAATPPVAPPQEQTSATTTGAASTTTTGQAEGAGGHPSTDSQTTGADAAAGRNTTR